MAAKLKYKVCVSGSARGNCSPDAPAKARQIGRLLAKRGIVVVTGATTGVPFEAAKAADLAGGFVIGISPAASKVEHLKTYKLPTAHHDLIVYTGFNYSGRNLFLIRATDASIFICGRIGTLSEFTIAFEDRKPIGILTETGGTMAEIRHILKVAKRGAGKVIYDKDPEALVEKLLGLLKREE